MNSKKHRNRQHRQAQVRFTRTVLSIITVVAMVVLVFLAAKAVGTMVVTGIKMAAISDNVQYYEEQRYFALETNRGQFATQCDEYITDLYAERNALINSDNPIVAFTALHKWQAIGCIAAFVVLVICAVNIFRRYPKELYKIFTKVIDVEEFLVRVVVAAVSCVVMIVCAIVGATFTKLAEAFNVVWNQSRPRRKPQPRPHREARKESNYQDNVIEFRRQA